ncbi:MAG: DUF370 domain-containing protein [Firmicutes bacterium]|nr:DUF370 domain-containing protein [Bacillota bacterium]
MFLHLGGDTIIPKEELIAILDLETTSKAEATKDFLEMARDEGFIRYVGEKGKEKSFVITSKYVYYSPISSMTLIKRASHFKGMISFWEKDSF